MPKRKFELLSRKTLSGSFEFKEFIGDLYNLNQRSYSDFLQKEIEKDKREFRGLEKVFKNFFPVSHVKSKIKIEYEGYTIGDPRMTPEDCAIRGINYGGNLKIFLKVTNLKNNEVKHIESSIGEVPLMTDDGTFIINGHEKVFVSQIQKCPGVIFYKDLDSTSNKKQSSCKIYPSIGSWIHMKAEKYISISIDKKRKFGIVSFLLCFAESQPTSADSISKSYDIKNILDRFNPSIDLTLKGDFWEMKFDVNLFQKIRLDFDIYYKDKLVAKKGEILTEEPIKILEKAKEIQIPFDNISNFFLAEDIYDKETGEIFCEVSESIQSNKFDILKEQKKIKVYQVNNQYSNLVLQSVHADGITTRDEALNLWGNNIKIGTHYGPVGLSWIFFTRFSDSKYYDFGRVGRKRMNQILNLNKTEHHLTIDDVIASVKELIKLSEDKREEDEIDSLVNKRFIGVGDIVENYFRLGLIKFEKTFKDKIYNIEGDISRATDIFNFRNCLYMVFDGFHKSAQMHDDNNRLSKIAQLRKVNSAGQGMGKERIASGLREINESKFGRMCTVQTPEGKKTGVIEHLALYASIDEDGFIRTPYHMVKDGIASGEIVFLTPFEERGKIISFKKLYQKYEERGKVEYRPKSDYLVSRTGNETKFVFNKQVDLINIADNQILSVSASLVPNVQNNDTYRVLSASNMNIQATPLVNLEAPFIGTGMENMLADKIIARNSGVVKYVDSTRIVVELDEDDKIVDLYNLTFNKRTNTETCMTHKPIVEIGDKVQKGDLIADGFSSINGELALGKNLLVAFMSNSYCYEDAFVISEDVLAKDKLTSINIQTHSCIVYETRNGPEKNTKDVPRVHSDLLRNLDESGIINIGARVKGGDILVGKVTPSSGEINLSSEYKLLNIIFGEKASEYSDSSMRLPHGSEGFVKGVRIITRKGVEKDGRSLLEDKSSMDIIDRDFQTKQNVIKDSFITKITKSLKNEKLLKPYNGQKKGDIINVNEKIITELKKNLNDIPLEAKKLNELENILSHYTSLIAEITEERQKKLNIIKYGYELPEGVLKIITIDIATKKIIEAGDKLCGRYGNKGVISTIFSTADMPHLKDGTPVDMIINPCGILARMNLGQIIETTIGYGIFEFRKRLKKLLNDYYNNHNKDKSLKLLRECLEKILDLQNISQIGFSSEKIAKLSDEEILELSRYYYENGIKVRIEQFSKITNEEMTKFLEDFGGEGIGKVDVYDGKTGEKFFGKVLVGYQFIMKLCHLVSKKMHARSIGPYSLVNQQPLGGKARFGGQRCGEMEVWALEAHGAAFNCNELLTTKSDDQKRRNRVFSCLTKVQKYSLVITSSANNKLVGESFKLLMYELRAAGFDLFLVDENGNKIERRL